MSKTSVSSPTVECAFGKMLPIAELQEHPRNPKKHPRKQIDLLAKVISSQGWRSPITVSTRSGFIVRGHGRLAAAKKLGLVEVPVDFQNYPSDEAELADCLADNRISELAEIDEDVLGDLLKELANMPDFDMDLTGFDSESIEKELFDTLDSSDIEEEDTGRTAMPQTPETGESDDQDFEILPLGIVLRGNEAKWWLEEKKTRHIDSDKQLLRLLTNNFNKVQETGEKIKSGPSS